MSKNTTQIVLGFSLLLISAVLFAGLAAGAGDDVLTEDVQSALNWTGIDVPDEVVRYGADGHPSWIVTVSDAEKTDSLDAWADNSDSREVQEWIDSDTALLSAPAGDVIHNWVLSRGGLEEKSYVSEIGFNVSVATPNPHPKTSSDDLGKTASLITRTGSDEWATGKATSANTTTIKDVRTNIGVDEVSETGSGVTVGIIDTGLTYDSALYQSRVTEGKNFISGETIDTGNDDYSAITDGNGHGDWVASAIAADPDTNTDGETYEGIAPDANLAIAKALDDDGSGETADIVAATDWACEQADVVNMSLGSPIYSEALADAVSDCVTEHDTPVVIAVGNSGYNPVLMFVSSPADTPKSGIISVGATTNDTAEDAQVAIFSEVGPDRGLDSKGQTTGEGVDVGAPGMAIEVQTADGMSTLSGTSMATPIVTANIALLDESTDLTPAETQTRLQDTAEPIPAAGVNEVGDGLVDAPNLINETEPDSSQKSVRDGDAESRDAFYEAYSGSEVIKIVQSVSSYVSG